MVRQLSEIHILNLIIAYLHLRSLTCIRDFAVGTVVNRFRFKEAQKNAHDLIRAIKALLMVDNENLVVWGSNYLTLIFI